MQMVINRYLHLGESMKIFASILLAVIAFSASFCHAEAVQPIDKFSLNDQTKWSCAKTIAIALFPVTGEFKGKQELSFYQHDFAMKLAVKLRKMTGIESKNVAVVNDKTNTTADIVIDGEFKDLTTGSRALRFWIGFGAGKSFCTIHMRGTDPKDGNDVFVLEHSRGSAMDFTNEDELIENIDEVVEDIAAGLIAARGACPVNATVPTQPPISSEGKKVMQ